MSPLRVGAIVQARMSSARLPGKVVRPLAGRPALEWLLERLAHAAQLDAVVVATSTEPGDDPIAELCAPLGAACHRGPLHDVAGRLLAAAEARGLDALVRVNGDSPLLDPRLVDRGVALFREGGSDVVTNVHPRSFPHGQSVEVITTAVLRAALALAHAPEDREHVTTALYREGAGVRIRNFDAGGAFNHLHMTLDTEDDARMLDAMLAAMDRPHWDYGWAELLDLRAAALAAGAAG